MNRACKMKDHRDWCWERAWFISEIFEESLLLQSSCDRSKRVEIGFPGRGRRDGDKDGKEWTMSSQS